MLTEYIKKLNPVILELKGKRINKVNEVIMPGYLYSFPNGICLSFELDDQNLNVKLGRQFSFDDYLPRLVLNEYKLADIYELKLNEIKYTFSHKKEDLDKAFDFLKDNLKSIINNYLQVLENENKKGLIFKDENRLKPYLLKDLSDAKNLEIELKYRIKESNEEINKPITNQVVSTRKNPLIDLSLWILVGLEVTAAILLIIWLFAFLEEDASEIPVATYIILALMMIISLSFLITLTVALFKKKRNK